MKFCYKCGESLSDEALFCSKCGCNTSEDVLSNPNELHTITQPDKKTNVCSVLAIIFGAIGIIPLLNFLFLPVAIILAIIGLATRKNKKKGTTIAGTIVVIVSLIISMCWLVPAFSGSDSNNYDDTISQEKPQLHYTEIYEGGEIDTDFVKIVIEDISTATTIKSENSTVVFNSDPGEHYMYMTGILTNTSDYFYDVGSLGSASYGNMDTMIDCNFEMSNGESVYGTFLTDDFGLYGLSSDGKISPKESVRFYFVFAIDQNSIPSGKITMAFTEYFCEEPSYDHSNCEYLYQIAVN